MIGPLVRLGGNTVVLNMSELEKISNTPSRIHYSTVSSQFIKKPDSYSYAIISKAERSTWPKQLEDPRKLQLRLELLPFLPLMPRMRGLFERQIDLIGYPVG